MPSVGAVDDAQAAYHQELLPAHRLLLEDLATGPRHNSSNENNLLPMEAAAVELPMKATAVDKTWDMYGEGPPMTPCRATMGRAVGQHADSHRV